MFTIDAGEWSDPTPNTCSDPSKYWWGYGTKVLQTSTVSRSVVLLLRQERPPASGKFIALMALLPHHGSAIFLTIELRTCADASFNSFSKVDEIHCDSMIIDVFSNLYKLLFGEWKSSNM